MTGVALAQVVSRQAQADLRPSMSDSVNSTVGHGCPSVRRCGSWR
jgi:hypothetical protein